MNKETEPWNLRADDTREADTKTTFIIFCEDTVSENLYFKTFATDQLIVNTIPDQKSKTQNVLRAITNLKELVDDSAHVWCVYDRDTNDSDIELQNTDFDVAVQLAESKGIKVAWSNDVFELWILLHLKDIEDQEHLYLHRADCYQALTDHFKAHSTHPLLPDLRLKETFNYKSFLKTAKNFPRIVLEEIQEKTPMAIARAKKLDERHDAHTRPSQKVPCTLIYKLVEELMRYQ